LDPFACQVHYTGNTEVSITTKQAITGWKPAWLLWNSAGGTGHDGQTDQ